MERFLRSLPEKLIYFCSMLISKMINRDKDLSSYSFTNILCIKEDEIGDLCYSLHVFDMLKKQFPKAKITLLCKPYAVSLTQDNPNIDLTTSNTDDLTGDYDLMVDLRGNWWSLFHAFVFFPDIRLDRGTIRYRNMGRHPHEVITNLQIVEPIISSENQITQPRIYLNKDALAKAEKYLLDNQINQFAVLHTGARKALRRWDKYAELAKYLKTQKGLDIIFTGDVSEVEEIEMIRQAAGVPTFSIAGEFNLMEFAALVSKAKIYVGNESGPLHIAAISGAPSLGLYGPGEPIVFYPQGERTDYIHYVLECNPCDQVHCVHPENPCIKRILLIEVIDKVNRLMEETTWA